MKIFSRKNLTCSSKICWFLTVPGDLLLYYIALYILVLYTVKKINGKKDYFCKHIYDINKIKVVFDKLVCIIFHSVKNEKKLEIFRPLTFLSQLTGCDVTLFDSCQNNR